MTATRIPSLNANGNGRHTSSPAEPLRPVPIGPRTHAFRNLDGPICTRCGLGADAPIHAPSLVETVHPHSVEQPTDWPRHPEKWEGFGYSSLVVDVHAPSEGTPTVPALTLRRWVHGGESDLQLDIAFRGAHNANGSPDDYFEESMGLTPRGLVALAEAFRRLVVLARAKGFIPADA